MSMWRVLGIVVAGLALLVGCSGADGPADTPLRIGWYPWLGWYPAAIVERQDLAARYGGRVELVLYEQYTDMLADVAAGRLDGCFNGLYEILRSGMPGLRVTLVTDYSDGAEGLVVTSDITAPADLRGRRIGIQGGASGSEYVVASLLRRHGVHPGDVILVDLEPEQVLAEMPDNIQGGYTWEPYLSQGVERGFHVLFSTADVPGMVSDVLVLRSEAVSRRARDVRAFHDAWFAAVDFWREHPAEAGRIIAERLGVAAPPGLPDGCALLDRTRNRQAFTLGRDLTSLRYSSERQVAFFMELGGTSVKPDLDAILDGSFVAVRP